MGKDVSDGEVKHIGSLYELAGSAVAHLLPVYTEFLKHIPNNVVIHIYKKAYELELTEILQRQLSNLSFVEELFKDLDNWKTIHQCLQLVLRKERDFALFLTAQKTAQTDNACYIFTALHFGEFLLEHGLYECSRAIYQSINIVDLNGNTSPDMLNNPFEVAIRIGHVLTLNCNYKEANTAILNASVMLNYMQNMDGKPNCAFFYTVCSMFMFSLSQYDKAYNLAIQAVRQLNNYLPVQIILQTLRQATKACIIKRVFVEAGIYCKEALRVSRHWYGERHAKMADCLSDYAFYLLSVDSVSMAVQYYERALSIRQECFGAKNVLTATTHEDLAYAIYVRDYSKGNFETARLHAEEALMVLLEVLPVDHLLLSSSKRVEALILEEVAIDSNDVKLEKKLLTCAENLHLDSLRLARNTFGEYNVQTAKHYGNLGRLYQSMKKFKEAENNHLKAIEIKEKLLGRSDYEVALSIGHLASLYNYDMEKYDQAESLYLRSIQIGKKLFGEWYSGLEYDYRGLIHLYDKAERFREVGHYQAQLADWKEIRDRKMKETQATAIDVCEDEFCILSILNTVKNANQQPTVS